MVGCYNSGVATAKNGSSHKEEQNEKSNHYLLLNAPMASLASLLRISSPLIAARSANNSSQCSVPSQKTFFSPRMAGTDLVNNRPAKASMASSMAAESSKISLYKPRWKAHSAERHSVALIAKSDIPANPSLRSTAGPTTNGPIPTASSLSFTDACLVA